MLVLAPGCSLYVHIRTVAGVRNEGESLADAFCVASAGGQKHQTRIVKKGQQGDWNDVCIFGEDVLLQAGRAVTFEVCSKGRWNTNTVLGIGILNLDAYDLSQAGQVLPAVVALHPPEKASSTYGVLSLELSAVHTVSSMPGALGELAAQQQQQQAGAAQAGGTLSPEVTVLPPGAPPRVLHCSAGTLYEEPTVVFLRLTIHKASGLRNATLDSPRTAVRATRAERASQSAASQRASAFMAKSKADIASFFGLRRRKPDSSSVTAAADPTPEASAPSDTSLTTPTATTATATASTSAFTPHAASVTAVATTTAAGAAPAATAPLAIPPASPSSAPSDAGAPKTGAAHSPGSLGAVGGAANAMHASKLKPHARQPLASTTAPAAAPHMGPATATPVALSTPPQQQQQQPQPPAAPAVPIALAAAAAAMAAAVPPPAVPGIRIAGSRASTASSQSVIDEVAAVALAAATTAAPTSVAAAPAGPEDADEGEGQEAPEAAWDTGSRTSLAGADSAEVNAKFVISELEANGFHVTDTPGGSHFYFKAGYEGQSWVSNMAQQEAGAAYWGQSFLLAAQRPLPSNPQLELDLLVSTDVRTRGRQACKFCVPLPELCADVQTGALGEPPLIRTYSVTTDDTHSYQVELSAELVDADPRASALGIPLISSAAAAAPLLSLLSDNLSPPPSPIPRTPSAHHAPAASPTASTDSPPLPAVPALPLTPSPKQPLSPVAGPRPAPVATRPPATAPSFSSPLASPTSPSPAAAPAPLMPPGAPPLATLHLMVSSFEVLDKPCDCFFIVKFGNFWCHSIALAPPLQPRWDWEIRLPVADPADLLSLGLFRASDQGPASKVVQATRSIVWADTSRSIGRLRIRPTTLLPGKLCCCRLPLHGDRTTSKGGGVTGYVRLAMRVEYSSTGACLLQYLQPCMYRPCILLMQRLDVGAEALEQARQKITFRWLEDCAPSVPARTARRMADDGRQEFTLSRTQQNWRRLTASVDRLQPLSRWFDAVCTWRSPLRSGTVAAGCVVLAAYPSKVAAVALAWLVVYLCTRSLASATARYGLPLLMAEELQVKADETEAVVAPLDPYTALKHNYDSLVAFSMKLQNVLDTLASSLERLVALLSWHDPVSTMLFIGLLATLATLCWLLGLRVLVCVGLLWAIRPPFLRDPYPPPPINFLRRLPRRSDVML